jgi:hypothetical protein
MIIAPSDLRDDQDRSYFMSSPVSMSAFFVMGGRGRGIGDGRGGDTINSFKSSV